MNLKLLSGAGEEGWGEMVRELLGARGGYGSGLDATHPYKKASARTREAKEAMPISNWYNHLFALVNLITFLTACITDETS